MSWAGSPVAACHMQHTNAKVSNYGNKLITNPVAATTTTTKRAAGAVTDGQAPHGPHRTPRNWLQLCSCSANFSVNLIYADGQTNQPTNNNNNNNCRISIAEQQQQLLGKAFYILHEGKAQLLKVCQVAQGADVAVQAACHSISICISIQCTCNACVIHLRVSTIDE